MEKQKKVIDASVVVKWFLNEEGSITARSLKNELVDGNIMFLAPELLLLEVINTLRYKRKDKKELIHISKVILNTGIKIVRLDKESLFKAIENSLKYDITIYDALYVTIAQLHGTFLITADKELLKIPNTISLEKT